jgi:hypothetical protein
VRDLRNAFLSLNETAFSHRWSVILAGGGGTRLPLLTGRLTGD